jgi:hypothetical protein
MIEAFRKKKANKIAPMSELEEMGLLLNYPYYKVQSVS